MLHTKFRENWPAGSGEDFLSGFYHLCHVTRISRTSFRSPYPWMLHIKVHFDWPSGFRDKDL